MKCSDTKWTTSKHRLDWVGLRLVGMPGGGSSKFTVRRDTVTGGICAPPASARMHTRTHADRTCDGLLIRSIFSTKFMGRGVANVWSGMLAIEGEQKKLSVMSVRENSQGCTWR